MFTRSCLALVLLAALALAIRPATAAGVRPAAAGAFGFSTGAPDGRIGMASHPGTGPGTPAATQDTEAADDFILTAETALTAATFTGLLPLGTPVTDIAQVTVDIYRVFPKDSDSTRTPRAPTRVNSPADVEIVGRDSADGSLAFTASVVSTSFTVANSVDVGINPAPNQTTGGEGAVTGVEVRVDVTFSPPIDLPADHYFFVPQVRLSSGGHFLWLSAPGPALFTGDLQTWMRNADLDPDWLRVGTDIVGGGARFNAAFSLSGALAARVAALNGSTYQFGAWNVGACSGQNSINIRNDSSSTLSGVTVSITGADAADFRLISPATLPDLGPQQTYAILVRFCPTGLPRTETTTLTLSGGNLAGGTQTIGLTGNGKLK